VKRISKKSFGQQFPFQIDINAAITATFIYQVFDQLWVHPALHSQIESLNSRFQVP